MRKAVATLGTFLAVAGGWAGTASADPAPHTFDGWTDTLVPGTQIYRATIGTPMALPAGTLTEFASVMVQSRDGATYTQIGWAWGTGVPDGGPQIFAYTCKPYMACGDSAYTWGPVVSTPDITVQIVLKGVTYEDQYRVKDKWLTLGSALIPGTVKYTTTQEDYGPPGEGTPFTGRGWYIAPIWYQLPSGTRY